jgi:hypothetical protein
MTTWSSTSSDSTGSITSDISIPGYTFDMQLLQYNSLRDLDSGFSADDEDDDSDSDGDVSSDSEEESIERRQQLGLWVHDQIKEMYAH